MKTIVDRQNMSIKKLLIVLAGTLAALFIMLTSTGCIRIKKESRVMGTTISHSIAFSKMLFDDKIYSININKRTVLSDRAGFVPHGSYPWLLLRQLQDQLSARPLTRHYHPFSFRFRAPYSPDQEYCVSRISWIPGKVRETRGKKGIS